MVFLTKLHRVRNHTVGDVFVVGSPAANDNHDDAVRHTPTRHSLTTQSTVQ